MGKCCAVYGCLSGRRNNPKNLHKCSFHKVPKEPELLIKWCTALGQELSCGKFVCQLHFNKMDLITENRTTLFDGNVFVHEYSRIVLRSGSIPQLNQNLNISTNVANILDERNVNVLPPVDCVSPNPVPTGDVDLKISGNCDEKFRHNDVQKLCINYTSIPQLTPNLKVFNNVANHADERYVNNVLSPVDCITPNPVPTGDVDQMISENCNEEFRHNEVQRLFITDLCNALKVKPLPSNWSWMLDKQFIILSCLDSTSLKPKCHLKINKDLRITIINAYTDICIDLDVIILDTDMVWEILDNMKNYHYCCGTGYDEKKCSSECKGMFLCSDYKKRVPAYRCIPCRQARQNIQNLNNKRGKTGKSCTEITTIKWS